MSLKDGRRGKKRKHNRSIEQLEVRQVMSADPVAELLGGSIQHHGFADYAIEHHGGFFDGEELLGGSIEHHAFNEAELVHHGGMESEAPGLIHHVERDADFWIDSWAERDAEALAGDIEKTLASAHGGTGLLSVRNDYGFIGTGQTVAVIDSGIAWDHVALGGGFGTNYRVVGGRDFTENDANPYDDGPEGAHGTHVAGIVGGDRTGTNDDGVAPGVDLVGLRVFDDAGAGYFHWVEAALQWVHDNRNSFENPITAVNLSIGTTWNDANSVPAWSMLEDNFAQLKADGIFISVSAGNSFTSYNTPGLSYPAASPHVVPVMATTDGGALASFSQRHTRAIAAPGRSITSTVPDYVGNNNGVTDDYAGMSGTSMAAPYVAGASVLLREAMQFVGYTNITQDTIYNHMMDTATSFFDSVTNQDYKRINLTNAFNALMPTDEYGSTEALAYNLGTLSGSSEVSGLIGKLSDADYFSFTASAAGTVSFTATTTHSLATVWHATGGTVSGSNGETYTFDVVAGQTYTIGLSTSGGIGYYDLAVDAESSFSYVDWGTITQATTNNVNNSGESWYRVHASQSGYLTAEAIFAAAGGNVDLALYDSGLQLVASGVANASGERIDVVVPANAEYFLRVTGNNADIDFRLTNLVSQSGATVSVAGTSGADTFSFAVGSSTHNISVNGATYQFNKAAVSTINFAGADGTDSITMTGGTGAQTATLRVDDAQLAGSGFTVIATDMENVTVHGGGGTDVARLWGTDGDERFNGYWDHSELIGVGFQFTAVDFDRVIAKAVSGTDRAYLYDTAGNDTYTGYSNVASLYGTGYRNDAYDFDRTYAYASQGTDRAYFYDSARDDTYGAWSDRAMMYSDRYRNDVFGFDRTYAYSTQGNDRAYFYDSAGDDTYGGWSDRAIMYGNGYRNDAFNFGRTYAYATQGLDRAYFYDSAGDDDVLAAVWGASVTCSSTRNEARSFDEITATLVNGGNNTVVEEAHDYIFNLVGVWS
jgi:subtilisin family serine protease